MGSSVFMNRLAGLFAPLAQRFSATWSTASSQRVALIVALVIAALVLIGLIAAIVLMPAKRKVVRKRRVRRVRRVAAGVQPAAEAAQAVALASAPVVTMAAASKSRSDGRGLSTAVVWLLAALLIVVSVVTAYALTGTNRYCGETCHGADPHVAVAVKDPHASCVACHESGPVSGMVSRLRMAMAGRATTASVEAAAVPVDPDRCLGCHSSVVSRTVKTKTGLVVSHKEVVAGGYDCSDCHPDVGHGAGASTVVTMARCSTCHDGKVARRECEVCHVGGSPLTAASKVRMAYTAFDYGPALRVANWRCGKCHAPERSCIACHNGLVLPHPEAFVNGGHARMSAFSGKKICYKCHTLAWCGSGKCHNGFSAHDPATWPLRHQTGTSQQCGSCHVAWNGKGSFCDVCH